jgi:hydroxylamine reductase
MFCRQCEQTQDNYACTGSEGVCGKTAETSACQDVLIHVLKKVSQARVAASSAKEDLKAQADEYVLASAFATLTNVNFSEERIAEYIWEGHDLLKQFQAAGVKTKDAFEECKTLQDLEAVAGQVSVPTRAQQMDEPDAFSLNEISTYGLKGLCAYALHLHQLRQELHKRDPSEAPTLDKDIIETVHKIWTKLASNEPDMVGLFATAMQVGEYNGKVLAALDEAHCQLLGVPTPTQVRATPVEGKCILVSGHDMLDLLYLLEQTEGTGVRVYTHGEMMPAHMYPNLAKFPHLVGNFGTAWQNQNFEFASFPGPVIVTTNCIVKPRRIYQDRIYTMNQVGFDGVKHIDHNRDFSPVIQQALACPGFTRTVEPASYHTTGFNHRAVLPLAKQILLAATSGALSRILLIGGCDGSQWNRSYFTDLAEEAPDDALILTLGCAKNRIIHSSKIQEHNSFTLPDGTVLPRVLDMGQCNDSYSAIVVATQLAAAAGADSVNDLPLSLALSHLEQKATAVLLTLLHLGVKNIRLGPSLPAYITPGVLQVLQEKFNLMGIDENNAVKDLRLMMRGQ